MAQRAGLLTWGQYLPWVTHNAAPNLGTYYKILTFDVTAPAGIALPVALGALDEIVERYEGLRTTFEQDDIGVRQLVHPMRPDGYRRAVSTGEPTDGEPAGGLTGWLTEPFDLAQEWPIRVAAWHRTDGRCVLRVAVHRMILDRDGMILIRSSLHRAFRTGSIEPETPEPAAWQPIDIAEFEQSAAGLRRDRRAHDYWHAALATAPETLFPTARPGKATDSRFTIRLIRADLRPLVRDLAAALRVTEPTVLMATGLLALSWISGWPRVCATIASNNRSRRELRRSLSPMLDRSLLNVVIDPGTTFGAWASALGGAMLGAYQHSHADPNTLLRTYAEVAMARGILLDRLPIINILGGGVATAPAPVLPAGAIPALAPDEYTTNIQPIPADGLYLRGHIMWRRVSIELITGEQIFDFATGERLVALFPAVLAALAEHGDLPIGDLAELVAEPRPAAGPLPLVDHTRIDLPTIRRLVGECGGVTDCAVFLHADGLRLHAYVAGDGRLDLAALRLAVLGRLPAYRQVLCPHRFTLVADPPERRDSQDAWAALPVLADGAGWPAAPRPANRPVESALAHALAETHPGLDPGTVDLGLPYSLAGGRFERIPGFLAALARHGGAPVSVDDLMSTRPLAHLLPEDR